MTNRIGSWELAKSFDIQHRNLRYAIESSLKELMEIDIVIQPICTIKARTGRIQEYLLTASQWKIVVMKLRNKKNHNNLREFVKKF